MEPCRRCSPVNIRKRPWDSQWRVSESLMEVDRDLLVDENRSSKLGPLLRIVTMIMANDYSARTRIFDVLQNIRA